MHSLESVEMENDEYDDNGLPSCDQNGEDDSGIEDGRNATELQRSVLEKLEDTGGTIRDFREQDDTSRQSESQSASTSVGDDVSPAVDEQNKVICGADDQNRGADRPFNCSLERGNGCNQDDTNEKNVTVLTAKLPIFSTKTAFLLIAVFCFGSSVTQGAMALTVIPGDVLASSGSTARIRCSTDYKNPVYWDRKLFGSDEQETIYYGKNGMARIDAGDRFRVEEDSSSGRYDLVISNVKMKDAGTYICIDEAGIGETYPAELVVFERFTCEMPVPHHGFMGENIFQLPENSVESTCSLSFRGSRVPRFQWTWGKVTRLMTPSTSINGSTVTSSVTLRATHDMNGAKLTCLPIVSTNNAYSLDDSSSRWISETVVVRYVHVVFGSVDECQSNAMIPICNPNCTYKVQETPDNRCQCLAVYKDQEKTCNKIFSEYSCGISESSSKHTAIIVAFAVLVSAASAIIVVLLRKMRRKEQYPIEENDSQTITSRDGLGLLKNNNKPILA